ncbi:MAG: endonuclease/exonuclease/phosphatase family protein [Anaerolineaceae bacterium]|nr:endonuclease/exonuclease/phosphatase family protein [Anaerolineaceae bacterium]
MRKTWMKSLILLFLLCVVLVGCGKNNTIEPTVTVSQPTKQPEKLSLRESLNVPDGVTISEIQGAGHRSPFVALTVNNVFGIVTFKRGDGFYIQDPEGDNNPETSEGIFVAIRGVPKVTVGDAVLINDGTVREFNPSGDYANSLTITQIFTTDYQVLSSDNDIPDTTVIGIGGRIAPNMIIDDDVRGSIATSGSYDIETDGIDFYESLESMLIQVNNAIAVSSTSQYKELAIVPDLGANAGVFTSNGGLLLQQGDANPERILLDDGYISMPMVLPGDIFTEPIIGILDYTFGNFKLQPINKLIFESRGLKPEGPSEKLSETQLSIATYNVENLDALDDPKRLGSLAEHIVDVMLSPDIIGLQEIMDNDGEINSKDVSADQSFQNIIDVVLAIGGPEYTFTNIDPERDNDGGAPGGNIRVGFLYRTDRGLSLVAGTPGDAITAVEVINRAGSPVLSLNPGRIDPENPSFFDSRKPLVAQFSFKGEDIFVVVNHLNSKGGDDPLYGGILPPNEITSVQRTAQARVINAFVRSILTINSEAKVVVLGDMNDFPWSKPMQALEKDVLTNLITTLPLEEQYTYIYDGNSQVLDQIFVSDSLIDKLDEVNILHINAEFYYQDRLSDHDPVLAVFNFD